MSTQPVPPPAKPPALYRHERLDAYECLGCGEMLEVPAFAVLKGGAARVRVKNDPENQLMWVQLMELDHEPCGSFKDVVQAESHRKFRHPLLVMKRK